MHIRPLPLGATLLGVGFISNAVISPMNQFARSPDWVAQKWRSVLRGAIGWFIAGAVFLVGGIIGLLV